MLFAFDAGSFGCSGNRCLFGGGVQYRVIIDSNGCRGLIRVAGNIRRCMRVGHRDPGCGAGGLFGCGCC